MTPDRFDSIRERLAPEASHTHEGLNSCTDCGRPWPCDSAVLADALAQVEAERDALRAAALHLASMASVVCAGCGYAYGSLGCAGWHDDHPDGPEALPETFTRLSDFASGASTDGGDT